MTDRHRPSEADLFTAAFHRERVLARRLVRQEATAFVDALSQVLQTAAGSRSLPELLASRRQAMASSTERRAARQAVVRLKFEAKKASLAPNSSAWQAWFDGSASPNPGRIGIGAVLQGPHGTKICISRAAGSGDGNLAEYLALITVLEAALQANAHHLVVHGDSQVVIGDVLGHAPVRTGLLQAQRHVARHLMARFASVALIWIPRARNEAADALARQAVSVAAAACSDDMMPILPEVSSSSMFDAVQK